MIKSFEQLQSLGKDSFEAYAASASALTKGFQAIAQDAAEYSRKSLETSTAAVERVAAAKSIENALEVQQGYAREAYNAYLGQLSKFGELYLSTAKEAYKPFEQALNGKPANQ
jgi:phasin family protein